MSINYHELSAEYDTTGVAVVADSVVDFKKVDRAREAIPDIRAGIYDTGVAPEKVWDEGTKKLAKMDNTHLSNKSIAELTASKEVGRVVAKVTGSNRVQVWATQLLEKPPTSGGKANVGWHQDRQYWTFWDTAEGLFTAWIALDIVGESSGPVRFVAGSHKWGFLESGDFFDSDIDKVRDGIKLPPGCYDVSAS